LARAQQLQGKELSYTNVLDLEGAWRAAVVYETPAICSVKHVSPCGIATHPLLAEAFKAALASDPISAFGGVIASKPYISSGAYINRMSDYCKGCAYDVAAKTGANACPFNSLYWHFLHRHRERFARNARMGQMYRVWDNMAEGHRDQVLADGDKVLAKLAKGEVV
jgi:hypothetical protein